MMRYEMVNRKIRDDATSMTGTKRSSARDKFTLRAELGSGSIALMHALPDSARSDRVSFVYERDSQGFKGNVTRF
jgi:hypothetical protein